MDKSEGLRIAISSRPSGVPFGPDVRNGGRSHRGKLRVCARQHGYSGGPAARPAAIMDTRASKRRPKAQRTGTGYSGRIQMDVEAVRRVAGGVQDGGAMALHVVARRHPRSGQAQQPVEVATSPREVIGTHVDDGRIFVPGRGEERPLPAKIWLAYPEHQMPCRGRNGSGDEGHNQSRRLAHLAAVLSGGSQPLVADAQGCVRAVRSSVWSEHHHPARCAALSRLRERHGGAA